MDETYLELVGVGRVPVLVHPANELVEGCASLSFRDLRFDQWWRDTNSTTRCLRPTTMQWRDLMRTAVITSEQEQAAAEYKRLVGRGRWRTEEEGAKRRLPVSVLRPELPIPLAFQAPYAEGLMIRVFDRRLTSPRPRDTLVGALSLISRYYRTYLCPTSILYRLGSGDPQTDPLHTWSLTYKPWIRRDAIPFFIRALLNPQAMGLAGRVPVRLAIASEKNPNSHFYNLELTKGLIERAFAEEQAGGFTSDNQWYPWIDVRTEPRAMTRAQAGETLGIGVLNPAFIDVCEIERRYTEFYTLAAPERGNPETNPDDFELRTEYVQMLSAAYDRLILERMVYGRPLTCSKIFARDATGRTVQLPETEDARRRRELTIASHIISLLCTLDFSQAETQGVVRVRWKKDAPARYGLKSKTLRFDYEEVEGQTVLQPVTIKKTIARWVHLMLAEAFRKQYYVEVLVEGLDW